MSLSSKKFNDENKREGSNLGGGVRFKMPFSSIFLSEKSKFVIGKLRAKKKKNGGKE